MNAFLRRAATLSLVAPLLLSGAAVASADGPDMTAPQVVDYEVISNDGDDDLTYFIEHEDATFTIRARITDATGLDTTSGLFNPGNPTITVSSEITDQSVGFGQMARVSGDAKDGWYERVVTIPEGSASGTWEATLYPLDDTLGNSTGFEEFAFFGTLGVIEIVYGDPVVPVAPTFDDTGRTISIPSVEGLTYEVNGVPATAGTIDAIGDVEVTAIALEGYVIDGESEWSHTFALEGATAAAPTFYDVNGTANDTYTIPSSKGVEYLVGGKVVKAGTYTGTGSVTITARALAGYELSGTATWSHSFNATTTVTAAAPTANTNARTYTIPTTTGVEYLVGGKVVKAGTYTGTGSVTVTARALTGYRISGTSTWSLTLPAAPATAAAPTFHDVNGTANDTYTIPTTAGVEYLVSGKVVKAGTYPGTGSVTVTARALAGYELSGTATWSHSFNATTTVIAAAPTSNTAARTYTIPTTTGVEYLVGGKVVKAGTYTGTGKVTITARALTGYRINGTTTWSLTLPAPSTSSPFLDVKPGQEHYEHMKWMADEKISTGWAVSGGAEYRPLAPVNRDAMAAFLYRMAGSPKVALPKTSPFTDVKPGQQHYTAIIWAYQKGITTGWTVNGKREFRPTTPINRDAMAAFLYRFAGKPKTSAASGSCFTDVSRTQQFAKEMCWMKSQGISTGWSDGTYRPLQSVKRDAMAAFLHRYDATY